jgi:hypothetical protein
MKKSACFSPLLILLFACLSCNNDQDVDLCQFDSQISSKQECYNPIMGLPLTVTGFSRAEGWEWKVYAVEDTTSTSTMNLRIRQGASETLYVPDSLLRIFPMIHVQASTNCSNSVHESRYFTFIRRQTNKCTTWVRKEMQ